MKLHSLESGFRDGLTGAYKVQAFNTTFHYVPVRAQSVSKTVFSQLCSVLSIVFCHG